MTVQILRAADRPKVPWRNGGGITREVATDGGEPFRWRVSIADVASDGPFSLFAGYARTITLLRGAGMRLTVDGITRTIDERYGMFRFPGAAQTECELIDGPVVDFNVMSADESARQRIATVDSPVAVAGAGTSVVVVLENTAVVRQSGAPDLMLGEFDAMVTDEPFEVSIAQKPAPVVAIIEFD